MQTETINKFLAPLDYQVRKYQETNPFTEQLMDSYGTYRTDTNHVFKTGLSSQYQVIQNRDAFQAIAGFAEHKDIQLLDCGTFLNGAEAWAQISLGEFQVGDTVLDTVDKRLTFYLSHNGTSMAKFLLAPFRFNCKNQMGMVDSIISGHSMTSSGKVQGIRIPHTRAGVEYMENFHEYINVVDGEFEILANKYNQLAETPITQETVAEVLNRLYPVDKESSPQTQKNQEKRQAMIAQFVSDADSGFIAWNTAWNLYNAITRYTTHERSFRNPERAQLIGSARDMNLEAYKTIADVISI